MRKKAGGVWQAGGIRLDAREIDKLAGMVNINAHNVSLGIEINHDAGRDFTDLGPDLRREVDGERVRVSIVMKLHIVALTSGFPPNVHV